MQEWAERVLEFICDKAMVWVILLLIAVSIALVVGLAYRAIFNETITLNKAEWKCTKSELVHGTVLMPIGKVVMPMPQTTNECFEYQRK